MVHWLTFSGTIWSFVPWVGLMVLWWWGGWGLLSRGFKWPSHRERAIFSWGVGMLVYIWLVNIIGRWLPSTWGFLLPAFILAVAGTLADRPIKTSLYAWLYGIWKSRSFWIWTGLLVFLLLEIEFGLLIFDEHKNLSLISTIAAGNLPPVNFYNPPTPLMYHYAFQIFGASLVRWGDLFPWIAFDMAKAITLGYGIALTWVILEAYIHPRWQRALSFAAIVLNSGTRYLLLLIPPMLLQKIHTVASFGALLKWRESGAPLAYPEAFLSGLKYPLIMKHAGPGNISLILFFLFWGLNRRWYNRTSTFLFAILLSVWALAWESSYGLVLLGIATFWLWETWGLGEKAHSSQSDFWRDAGVLSLGISLVQGGTLTQMARHLVAKILPVAHTMEEIGTLSSESGAIISLRWPPAVLSAHLGPLSLFSPENWLVILAEAGVGVVFIPWAVQWIKKRVRDGKSNTILEIYVLASGWGILLPVFIRYRIDRDVSRLTSFALLFFFIILAIAFWNWVETRPRLAWGVGIALIIMAVPGVVLGGMQLSAIQRPRLGELISLDDAEVSRQIWNRLPQDALIFDPRGWPAVAITGRLTRYGVWRGRESPLHRSLVENPSVEGFLEADFSYVYVPSEWWLTLTPQQQEDLSQPCVNVIAESGVFQSNTEGQVHFRRVLDISGCRPAEMSLPPCVSCFLSPKDISISIVDNIGRHFIQFITPLDHKFELLTIDKGEAFWEKQAAEERRVGLWFL